MKSMTGEQLRTARSDFWLSKEHKLLPEASLVGGKESTAMFNIAGMQQLIPYLNGKKHPLGTRLFNIQKCIRTVDIDEVGDASHLTFFEMMGNRSLGDYFKKDSVNRSREFLVDVLWFDKEKLAATVFEGDRDTPRDEETAGYRKAYLPEHKIAYLPAGNNWWSPGPVWPCGPDTEIFYWVGKSEYPPVGSNPGTDEDNRLEIWNNVFMQFYRDESGQLTLLDNKNVDTGMGFERMCKVLQGKESVYETDIFDYILTAIERISGKKYTFTPWDLGFQEMPECWEKEMRSMRIIADHLRTSFFLCSGGIIPSNEGRGYILRRLVRRMYYNLLSLSPSCDLPLLLTTVCEAIVRKFGLSLDFAPLAIVLQKECLQFQKTIANWEKMLADVEKKMWVPRILSGKDAFMLYDTFWFPLELTKEIAVEKWFHIDEEGFVKEMEAQQQRSRAGSKDMFKQDTDRGKYLKDVQPTQFVWYGMLSFENAKLLKDFEVNGQRILIFDQTPFYAESWGQKWDYGTIVLDSWEELQITEVKKYEWVFLHFVK